MFCAVYVVYTVRNKTYRDRIARNLLLSDAEALARQKQGQGHDRIDLVSYPAYPFRHGPATETLVRSVA